MAERLILDRIEPTSFAVPDLDFRRVMGDLVRANAESRAACVEQRILEGEDEIRLPYVDEPGGREIVYAVPRWREHPIKRFRVALARRRYRS